MGAGGRGALCTIAPVRYSHADLEITAKHTRSPGLCTHIGILNADSSRQVSWRLASSTPEEAGRPSGDADGRLRDGVAVKREHLLPRAAVECQEPDLRDADARAALYSSAHSE